jgi:hypothetical protein
MQTHDFSIDGDIKINAAIIKGLNGDNAAMICSYMDNILFKKHDLDLLIQFLKTVKGSLK